MDLGRQVIREPIVSSDGQVFPIEKGIYPNLTLNDGTYLIINYSSRNCLSVDTDGCLTQVDTIKDKNNRWEKKGKLLRHIASGKYLEVNGDSLNNMSHIGVREKSGRINQNWIYRFGVMGWMIISEFSGRVRLDIPYYYSMIHKESIVQYEPDYSVEFHKWWQNWTFLMA